MTIQASNGTGTGGSGSILLQTASAGSTGATANTLMTRMAITSGGNVGIGTTSPAGLLDVNGKLTVLSGGNVGIGTTNPNAKFQVSGQAASTVGSGSTTTIDFNTGNIQTTSVAGGSLTLSNVIDGASYTLVLTGAGTFTLPTTGAITSWKCSPACTSNQVSVSSGKETILSFFKIGTTGYLSWIKDL
jgi:hypothetical protein